MPLPARPALLPLLAACAVLLLPAATAFMLAPAEISPSACVGFTVGSQEVHVFLHNPYGGEGPLLGSGVDSPLPYGGWFAFVNAGPGGC